MNLNTSQLLENAVRAGASDVFIVAGLPVSMRINGVIAREDECRLFAGRYQNGYRTDLPACRKSPNIQS